MSVSLAVAAKHALAPMPWMQSALCDDNTDSEIALNGTVMHFVSDRNIYEEGDEARSFYKVVSGVVRTCRFLSDGRRQIDAFYTEGDLFGLEAGADHRLSAEAVSECTVIAYRRRADGMMLQDDRLTRQLFSHAMTSLARAQEHSLLLGRATAAQKIATFLIETARRGGCDLVIELAMSRQDIADYLGLTIETVSRTLSQLERDAVIALPSARRVVLKDRRALERMVG